MERAFKGIWIPKEIWLSKELTLQEKVFLAEIDSLDNKDGCHASNKYFSEFFSLSRSRCSEIINSLEKKGFISVNCIRKSGQKNIEKRVIRVFGKPDRGVRNPEGGYSGNTKENNTSNNINPSTRKKVFDEDSLPFKIAAYHHKKIMEYAESVNKAHLVKRANLQRWADEYRKMLEIDKVGKDEIKEVIDWVSQDSFWRTNILSAGKMRKQFTTLSLRMAESKRPYKPKVRERSTPTVQDVEFSEEEGARLDELFRAQRSANRSGFKIAESS